jgi:hypothetical protein
MDKKMNKDFKKKIHIVIGFFILFFIMLKPFYAAATKVYLYYPDTGTFVVEGSILVNEWKTSQVNDKVTGNEAWTARIYALKVKKTFKRKTIEFTSKGFYYHNNDYYAKISQNQVDSMKAQVYIHGIKEEPGKLIFNQEATINENDIYKAQEVRAVNFIIDAKHPASISFDAIKKGNGEFWPRIDLYFSPDDSTGENPPQTPAPKTTQKKTFPQKIQIKNEAWSENLLVRFSKAKDGIINNNKIWKDVNKPLLLPDASTFDSIELLTHVGSFDCLKPKTENRLTWDSCVDTITIKDTNKKDKIIIQYKKEPNASDDYIYDIIDATGRNTEIKVPKILKNNNNKSIWTLIVDGEDGKFEKEISEEDRNKSQVSLKEYNSINIQTEPKAEIIATYEGFRKEYTANSEGNITIKLPEYIDKISLTVIKLGFAKLIKQDITIINQQKIPLNLKKTKATAPIKITESCQHTKILKNLGGSIDNLTLIVKSGYKEKDEDENKNKILELLLKDVYAPLPNHATKILLKDTTGIFSFKEQPIEAPLSIDLMPFHKKFKLNVFFPDGSLKNIQDNTPIKLTMDGNEYKIFKESTGNKLTADIILPFDGTNFILANNPYICIKGYEHYSIENRNCYPRLLSDSEISFDTRLPLAPIPPKTVIVLNASSYTQQFYVNYTIDSLKELWSILEEQDIVVGIGHKGSFIEIKDINKPNGIPVIDYQDNSKIINELIGAKKLLLPGSDNICDQKPPVHLILISGGGFTKELKKQFPDLQVISFYTKIPEGWNKSNWHITNNADENNTAKSEREKKKINSTRSPSKDITVQLKKILGIKND